MRLPPHDPFALAAFAFYVSVSLVVGEVYPFSEFAMYSRPLEVRTVAAPWFAADGQRANADAFGCFRGVDPAQLTLPDYPLSTRYIWHEWKRWATTRTAGSETATVPVEFGYVLLHLTDSGVQVSEPIVQTSGLACLR